MGIETAGHTPGFFWLSQLNQHVHYESFLESRALLQLDYEGKLEFVLEQPFALCYGDRKHIPDFLVRYAGGRVSIIDVKLRVRQMDPDVQRAFSATRQAVGSLGWTHEVHGEPDPQFALNLDWLSAFRRSQPLLSRFSSAILNALAAGPLELEVLIDIVGERLLSRPIVFHLLWKRVLQCDLHAPLTNRTPIRLAREVRA